MMGILIAFWVKIFFRKYTYNLIEILVLLCYVMGMGMVIFSVFSIVEGLTYYHTVNIASVVGFIYCAWAIAHFYDGKKIINYLKSFGAYMFGFITFYLLMILVGALIDITSK
jgi:hypothetical protein